LIIYAMTSKAHPLNLTEFVAKALLIKRFHRSSDSGKGIAVKVLQSLSHHARNDFALLSIQQ